MDNENSFTDCFEDSFNVDDISDIVATLKIALESVNSTAETLHLRTAIRDCMSRCAQEFLEKKVFGELLPLAERLVSQIIEKIDRLLSEVSNTDALEMVLDKLTMCKELLDFWHVCVEHISNLRQVSASDVKSLLEYFPKTVISIFGHCKSSPTRYGILFDSTSKELTCLFRKGEAILKLFLATLEDVIVFDTNLESETELLAKVINVTGTIAATANGMDFRTFVETTKAFDKLAIAYQNDIKRNAPLSVTSHLKQISRDISFLLTKIKDPHNQVDERIVKGTGFLLKMLKKLVSAYSSYLSYEILTSLIDLLTHVLRCSSSCLRGLEINEEIIDLAVRHIAVWSEPFLNIIFKNSDFKQAYFDYGRRDDIDKLGYHLITIWVMRKLIPMPRDDYSKWILEPNSIVDVAMSNINDVQAEICTGEIELSGTSEIGDKPRIATLYESTLVPMCSLISRLPVDGFCALELLLLKHLLSDRFWSSLFSADTWCFIDRLGSTDLCASHVKYLTRLYNAMEQRRDSLSVIMLENLIGRLYGLLPEETKHSLIVNLHASNDQSWRHIVRFMPQKTKTFLSSQLATSSDEITKVFADLETRPTVENWNRFDLASLSSKLYGQESGIFTDILYRTWTVIDNTIESCKGILLDMLSDLLVTLLKTSGTENLQTDVFLSILGSIGVSYSLAPTHARACVAHYLHRNSRHLGDFDSRVVAALAKLCCRLLEDDDPWVKQEGFECFDRIAHTCPNEDLVAGIAKEESKRERTLMKNETEQRSSADKEKNTNTELLNRRVDRICEELKEIWACKDDIDPGTLMKLKDVLGSLVECDIVVNN
ncbi:hypothetical protein KM043_010765 [Ampulex compressa]|nr:hypothetical protein KM043_010765 [Ampulex compressa]